MAEGVASDWEDRGRLPAVALPCRGVTMPLGSCVPGMICSTVISKRQTTLLVLAHNCMLKKGGQLAGQSSVLFYMVIAMRDSWYK